MGFGRSGFEIEEILRQAGAYIKREMDILELRKERALTLGVLHNFLSSDASRILMSPEASLRGQMKRIESVLLKDSSHHLEVGIWISTLQRRPA